MMNDDIEKVNNILSYPDSHFNSRDESKTTRKDTISSMTESEYTMDNFEQRNYVGESSQYKLTNFH